MKARLYLKKKSQANETAVESRVADRLGSEVKMLDIEILAEDLTAAMRWRVKMTRVSSFSKRKS